MSLTRQQVSCFLLLTAWLFKSERATLNGKMQLLFALSAHLRLIFMLYPSAELTETCITESCSCCSSLCWQWEIAEAVPHWQSCDFRIEQFAPGNSGVLMIYGCRQMLAELTWQILPVVPVVFRNRDATRSCVSEVTCALPFFSGVQIEGNKIKLYQKKKNKK